MGPTKVFYILCQMLCPLDRPNIYLQFKFGMKRREEMLNFNSKKAINRRFWISNKEGI